MSAAAGRAPTAPALRWAAAALAVVIAVALVLVWTGAAAMRRQLAEDFNQQQLVLARQAAAAIAHRLRDVEEEALAAARMLRRVELDGTALEAALEAMLARSRELGVTAVQACGDRGVLVAGRGAEGEPCVTPVPARGAGGLEVHARHAVVTRDGSASRVEAEVVVTLPEDRSGVAAIRCRLDVTRLIRGVAEHVRSGRTGYPWVIDGRGTFLYHPDPEFVGHDAFAARRQRAPEIDFASIDRIMRDQMLAGREGTGRYVSGWHGGMHGRIEKLIAFAPVAPPEGWGDTVWSVAVVAPESELSGAVHRVYVKSAAAMAALVVALAIVAGGVVALERRRERELRAEVERAEAELADLERISRRVVEQASDLIYLLDLEGRLVLANPAAVAMFSRIAREPWTGEGAPPRELYLGRPVEELLRPEDARFLADQVERVLFCAARTAFEHTVRVDGEPRRLSTRLVPVRDETRRIHYVLGIARDVTEKQLMEQRLYNTEKLASIGTLAAGVAHEINNPLAVILGYAELLLERLPEDGPEREDLEVIVEQATAAKRVVDGLLGFARVTEGLEETVDVAAAVGKVAAIVRNTLMTRKIVLDVEVPPELPRVAGDPREFQQVVFNLVTNAVGALGDGGGHIAIRARVTGDGWVEVRVEDDGCGIPPHIRNRIFDPFFTTKPVGKGTGLGLSLAYGIVSKYGGSIAFESVSREERPEGPTGTTFVVRLPVAEEDAGGEG